MKKVGVKKLELKRLTVKQLSNAGGAGWVLRSGGSACSNTCSTCDPNNSVCWVYLDEPTDNCGGGGGGGSCGGGNLEELNKMC
jgi:hypothetical protein